MCLKSFNGLKKLKDPLESWDKCSVGQCPGTGTSPTIYEMATCHFLQKIVASSNLAPNAGETC